MKIKQNPSAHTDQPVSQSITKLLTQFIDFYQLSKSISIIRGDSIDAAPLKMLEPKRLVAFAISTQFSFVIKSPDIFFSQFTVRGEFQKEMDGKVIFRSKIEKLICDFRSNYTPSVLSHLSRGQTADERTKSFILLTVNSFEGRKTENI